MPSVFRCAGSFRPSLRSLESVQNRGIKQISYRHWYRLILLDLSKIKIQIRATVKTETNVYTCVLDPKPFNLDTLTQ